MAYHSKEKVPVLRNDVYQSNPLIQARKEFDALGMRIFLLGLRGLNPHFSLKDKKFDEKFPELFISTEYLTELLGGNTVYLHNLKEACDKIFKTVVELNYENGGFVLMHMFDRLEYVPRDGLYLRFDEQMRPYLLDLFEAKGYTALNVEQIFGLTSTYAVRLVEIMLQYQNIPEYKEKLEIIREIDMDDFRFMLNVPKDAYAGRFDNFRKFVLDEPIAEINEKTLYEMSYVVIKRGRTVTGFELRMKIVPMTPKEQKLVFGERAIEELKRLGFTEDTAMNIWQKCKGTDDCLKRLSTAQKILRRQKKKKPVENELGFLRQAIEENWQLPAKRSRKPPAPKYATAPKQPPVKEVLDALAKTAKTAKPPAPKTPPKKELSTSDVQILWQWLGSPNSEKYALAFLKKSNLTLEEFKEKYPLKRA